MNRARKVMLGVFTLGALAGCEGSGSGGGGLEIRNEPITPNCTPVTGTFPPGLAVLSEATARATVVTDSPNGLSVYGLDAERPTLLTNRNFGVDSDGDGLDDRRASESLFPIPKGLVPVPGELRLLDDHRSLISTSNYEQVLVYDPSDAQPIRVILEVPASIPFGRYPLLPEPGSVELRTGISTFACLTPDPAVAFDSTGGPVGSDPRCAAQDPAFLSSTTAGKAVAAGRLFVATSNFTLSGGSRYRPGTVLVYDWIEAGGDITVRPSVETPALFTTGFNPTGLGRHVTESGRELVLAVVTGAIGPARSGFDALTEAAVDVIDPSVPRIAATIPLGFAGAGLEAPAIDPSGQIAWMGSAVRRELYAIDLRALDDPKLYEHSEDPPVILDGLTTGFPDARVFDADHPLRLPDRTDRPSSPDCAGFTFVTVNASGTEAFATDFCDGTLTRIRLDLTGAPPIPFARSRFQVAGQSAPFAPNTAIDELRFPGAVATRPGRPGIDFTSPDVLVAAGDPPQLCALRIESP